MRLKGHTPCRCGDLKGLDCLNHQGSNVPLTRLHGKFAGINAGDIDQIADQSIHARAVALDTRSFEQQKRAVAVVLKFLSEELRTHHDSV